MHHVPTSQRLIFFPSYIEPHRLAEFSKRRPATRTLILNPNSGPGTSPDGGIQKAAHLLRASGAVLLGYVPTGYTKRPASEVAASIQKFIDWYDVDGIFFDETEYRREHLPYYQYVAALARGSHQRRCRIVAMNPGMVPDPAYVELADVTVTFEGPANKYPEALAAMPPWLHSVPAHKIAHIMYDAPRDVALHWAQQTRAGHFYATSGRLPNPWITLPDYYDEMEAVLSSAAPAW